jgi:radical SAM superfamily enzyme YgiQ (UPF0313 family)
MKILLIKSGNLNTNAMSAVTHPLGIMYIASYLRATRKDSIKILDTRISKDPFGQIQKNIREFMPQIIGISAITLEAQMLHKIASYIKSNTSNVMIIAGGPHATIFPEDVLKNAAIDIAVIGEGEETFKELMDVIDQKGDLRNVDGIVFKQNGNIIKTRKRRYIQDLDRIPYPAYDLINIEEYAKHPGAGSSGLRLYMTILTSRGCPFKCTYCHKLSGFEFRARTPENIINEIKMLIEQYNIFNFEIIDDIANFNVHRFKYFLSLLKEKVKSKIFLSFPGGLRGDLLDEETIALMKEVGTVELSLAIETASQRLQKLIKKNLNIDKVKKIIDFAVDKGIYVRGAFMLGFPTETKEEIKATINLACKSKLHEAHFFAVNPFGGTELSKQILSLKKDLPQDIQYNELDFHALLYNATQVSDSTFKRLYIYAYLKFYFNPKRIIRLFKDKKKLNDLPLLAWWFLKNIILTYLPKKKRKAELNVSNFNNVITIPLNPDIEDKDVRQDK